MKRILKKVLLALAGLLLIAQFIQPDRSAPPADPSKDMLTVTGAPADIQQLVIGACYDCHSYKTVYPWYAYVTPMNFIVQDHVEEGREHLNFSLWNEYFDSEEAGESGEEIQEGEMPLDSYTWTHADARLSTADRRKLVAWFDANVPGGGEGGGKEGVAGAGEEVEHEH